MADMKKVYNDLIIINLYFLNYLLGGYPQQQSGYQPVATYPDNPPPYPGPPLGTIHILRQHNLGLF